ncbi:MAG: nucleotidyltransferase family protein [Promethearchaeota archaeon]
MKSLNIYKLRKIFLPLREKYDVIAFGSQVKNSSRPSSDIDIAILTYSKNTEDNIKTLKDLLGEFPLKFDIRVFELLPLHIQMSIINDYIVIYGNTLDISEYFYMYRKKWDNCKHRILSNQFSSYEELL